MKYRHLTACLLSIAAASKLAAAADAVIDSIHFGDSASEQSHALRTDHSTTTSGGLGQPARQLLPFESPQIYGGSLIFNVQCDPQKQNYVTFKFWGSDSGEDRGRLLLMIDGKQLGVRHLGDYDDLDIMGDAPRFLGRFYYKTLPLPRELTTGKTSLQLEVRSLGKLWGYGTTWDAFQKNMASASRGIYMAYVHSDPYFTPPGDEAQGALPENPPVAVAAGPEVLDQLKARVSHVVQGLITSTKPLNQMQIQLIARAQEVAWTPAYQSPEAMKQIIRSLDALYLQSVANPKLVQLDPATPNPDWFGFGPAADAIRLNAARLSPAVLDARVEGGNGITRRAAWTEMMLASREWHRQHRRQYTNQSMIKDLYGVYLPNRAIAILLPRQAMPEAQAMHYLYQAVGLEPWLGSDTDHGPEKPLGDHYFQLTNKGLTRELGYVGAYGEVLDWMTSIYESTSPAAGQPGDEKIKAQLIKIANARAVFREPLLDAEGNRAMALETVVGWRDSHYPGDITYGQRTTWDAGAFDVAAATQDPGLIAIAHQMLDDNQFFSAVAERMKEPNLRVTAGLLATPDSYATVTAATPSDRKLPMTPGQPDFVFSDEEDGVVAFKHGGDVVYASLYWRARFAINNLARVHLTQGTIERDATCVEATEFDDSGLRYKIDDRIVESQTRRFEVSRGNIEQALTGIVLPVAKVPAGTKYKLGDENVAAGKGTFYTLRYGPYLIGMNMTTDRTFTLAVPGTAVKLPANTPVNGTQLQVGPRSTTVLLLNDAAAH